MHRLIFLLVLCLACSSSRHGPSTSEYVRDHWLTVRKTTGLDLVSVDGAIDSYNCHIKACYTAYNLLEVETGRKLIVNLVDGIRDRFNHAEEWAEYLVDDPMTDDCIEIEIDADHFFGEFFGVVYLDHISLYGGYINYYDFNQELVYSEPYERASSIVHYDRVERLRKRRAQASGPGIFSEGFRPFEFESDEVGNPPDPANVTKEPTQVEKTEEVSSVESYYGVPQEETVAEPLFPEVTQEVQETKEVFEEQQVGREPSIPDMGSGPYKMGQ